MTVSASRGREPAGRLPGGGCRGANAAERGGVQRPGDKDRCSTDKALRRPPRCRTSPERFRCHPTTLSCHRTTFACLRRNDGPVYERAWP
ncbi:hypothetical protein HPB47_005825 [Ixodes persulcatus]|uniref:Uncharacterized protein n=1 Tax=Ixodes persulcatus TaxID=34615 RepID=A0AC60PBW0_IXOPE|nr:hypothetical protein HPB47_005825 [Ixodes persulcatus]